MIVPRRVVRGSFWLALVPLILPLVLRVGPAMAQDRSEPTPTGRQRAETGRRRSIADEDTRPVRWSFAVGAGIMASGDLFKVRVPSGNDLLWQAPGGSAFNSDRFTVTLDEDLQITLVGSWQAASRLFLRGEFSWARLQATALAIVGQTGEVVPYDEISFYLTGLAAEYRLIAGRTTPYLLGGGAWVVVRSAGDAGLDQSRPGFRFGAGLHHAWGGRWALRGEIRDTLVDLDLTDYRPRAAGVAAPNIELQSLAPQHLWEIFVSLVILI
jgi:hypothetical protein